MSDLRERIHIVLVRPIESLNIGMVARAMKNLGYSSLRLVAPVAFDRERASITARTAIDIVDQATQFETLPDALADLEDVVGFSGKDGNNRSVPLLLSDWVSDHWDERGSHETGLVFGPEDSGLHWDDLIKCRRLVRIKSADAYPSFNLAQAVLLALYELSRSEKFAESVTVERLAASGEDFEQLDRLTEEVLTVARFYTNGPPEHVPGMVTNIFRRADPDRREMAMLLGLFSRIAKTFRFNGISRDD